MVSDDCIRGNNIFAELFKRFGHVLFGLHTNKIDETLVRYKYLGTCIATSGFIGLLGYKEGISKEELTDSLIPDHAIICCVVPRQRWVLSSTSFLRGHFEIILCLLKQYAPYLAKMLG